jgi:hypothetical protein
MADPVATAVSSAVAAGGVTALLYLLLQSAKRPAKRDPETGDLVLQFGAILPVIMGTIAVGAPIGLAILAMFVGFKNPNERYIPMVMGAGFLLLGGGPLPYLLKTRIRVGADGLVYQGVFGQPRTMAWPEIVRVQFKSDGSLTLISAAKKRIQVQPLMVGIGEFAEILDEHLPEAAWGASVKDLDRFSAMLRR